MSRIAISQSNFIPWRGYFDLINSVDDFVVYDEMQYTRRDWRNRNKIKTKDGLKWLSVPVTVKDKFHQKINETLINDPKWGTKAWEVIRHSYAKAPFFSEYSNRFEEIFKDNSILNLSELNVKLMRLVCEILNINTRIHYSKDFTLHEERNHRLLNICKELGASVYLSGPAAKDYLDTKIFDDSNISVEWFDFNGYVDYEQQFGNYEYYVSILDLIFNVGNNAEKIFNLKEDVQ